jgi:hypothetical protein
VTGQLFPALDTDLDLIGVDEQRCLLLAKAVYDPPWAPPAPGSTGCYYTARHAQRCARCYAVWAAP